MLKVRIVEMDRQVIKQLGFNWNAVIGQAGSTQFLLAKRRHLRRQRRATRRPRAVRLGDQHDDPAGDHHRQLEPAADTGCRSSAAPAPTAAREPSPPSSPPPARRGSTRAHANIQAFEQVGLVRTLAEPNLTAVSGESAKFLVGGEFPVPSGRIDHRPGLGRVQALRRRPRLHAGRALRRPHLAEALDRGLRAQQPGLLQRLHRHRRPGAGGAGADRAARRDHGRAAVGRRDDDRRPAAGQDRRRTWPASRASMDVPILGALFRSRDYQAGQTELVIIVTPYLVKPTSPTDLQTPIDGLQIANDVDTILLGRLNKTYKHEPERDDGKNLSRTLRLCRRVTARLKERPPCAHASGSRASACWRSAPARRPTPTSRPTPTAADHADRALLDQGDAGAGLELQLGAARQRPLARPRPTPCATSSAAGATATAAPITIKAPEHGPAQAAVYRTATDARDFLIAPGRRRRTRCGSSATTPAATRPRPIVVGFIALRGQGPAVRARRGTTSPSVYQQPRRTTSSAARSPPTSPPRSPNPADLLHPRDDRSADAQPPRDRPRQVPHRDRPPRPPRTPRPTAPSRRPWPVRTYDAADRRNRRPVRPRLRRRDRVRPRTPDAEPAPRRARPVRRALARRGRSMTTTTVHAAPQPPRRIRSPTCWPAPRRRSASTRVPRITIHVFWSRPEIGRAGPASASGDRRMERAKTVVQRWRPGGGRRVLPEPADALAADRREPRRGRSS